MTLLAMTAAGQLAALLDRAAVTQVVNDWGLFRDTGRWDELRALYARDAEMLTTWYAGDAEGFVACTSRVLLAASSNAPPARPPLAPDTSSCLPAPGNAKPAPGSGRPGSACRDAARDHRVPLPRACLALGIGDGKALRRARLP